MERVFGTSLLAFFAFIGFEDMVNLAEEVKDPGRNMPQAIFLTLLLTTLIYFLVIAVAVLAVPAADLAASKAPLSLVFETLTGGRADVIGLIAVFATLNGIIIQMIMASRVLYGLAEQGSLPAIFGRVNRTTRTPTVATVTVVAVIVFLAVSFPIDALAEWTSRIILGIFALVNLSLAVLKLSGQLEPSAGFTVPLWVPVGGIISCLGLVALSVVF